MALVSETPVLRAAWFRWPFALQAEAWPGPCPHWPSLVSFHDMLFYRVFLSQRSSLSIFISFSRSLVAYAVVGAWATLRSVTSRSAWHHSHLGAHIRLWSFSGSASFKWYYIYFIFVCFMCLTRWRVVSELSWRLASRSTSSSRPSSRLDNVSPRLLD